MKQGPDSSKCLVSNALAVICALFLQTKHSRKPQISSPTLNILSALLSNPNLPLFYSEFHHQVAGQASRLNKLTAHTATLLGNIPECDSLALLPLHQLNGGEGEPVDLMGVVTHARQFRISSPMMTLFGDGESEQPACVGLVRQFTSLVCSRVKVIVLVRVMLENPSQGRHIVL